MKLSRFLFATIAICLCACQFIFAQKTQSRFSSDREKIITEAEFEALKNKAEEKLKSGDYRIKTVEETYAETESTPGKTIVEIYESSKPDKMRVTTETTIAGSPSTKTGFMMIGENRYILDKNGKWVLEPRSGGRGTGSGSGIVRKPPTYKFIGKSKLDGKTVLVYEVAEKYFNSINDKLVRTSDSRYFFSPDGKLLREEWINDNLESKLKVKKSISNEYNAAVNIQPPDQL